jgi:xanthine dehydrogenase accessory factor
VSERASVWYAACELAQAGAAGALATVSRQRGSLPMARDAKLLVAQDGRSWGTVGGGCTEADVAEQALAVAQSGAPSFVRHTLNADLAGDVGLSCGGTVELFLEPVVATPEMAALYGALAEAAEHRVAGTVLTAVDWSGGPRKEARIGDELVRVGAPFDFEPGTAAQSRAAAHVDERLGALVEPLERVPRVVIFGAGYVGRAIAKVAADAGFYVLITDDREEFADPDRMPWAHEVIAADFRAVLDRLSLDADDYVLAATRGHGYDAEVVERTATSPARYVGMLGSARKRAVIFEALQRAGVPREALQRVRVPIGEDIGADTPAEIAVSVVAELIRVRRTGETAG